MTPHVIRLRGPWRWEALPADPADDEPRSGRCQPPCSAPAELGDNFRGRVRYERTFNRPTGLDASTRVLLVLESTDTAGDASLNNIPLGSFASGDDLRVDVSQHLERLNRLALEVNAPPGSLSEHIRLEITAGPQ